MPRRKTDTLRIGSGAGFAGDRLEPAVILAERGGLQYLGLECLAERTIALAQLRKLKEPAEGYDVLLARRMELLLPVIKKKRVRLITNMGAANPVAAADLIVEIAKRRKLDIKVAAVTGDDVLKLMRPTDRVLETGEPLSAYKWLVSANAYLGVDALLPALATGADIIITGRVADPSLFLAPAAYEYGWQPDDLDRMARGTVMGHLLECAGQITGGYCADPGRKDIPDFAHIGFPYADVDRDGNCIIGKPAGTGGAINLMTAKEQLLYEVTDPRAYVTPDITADFTTVQTQAGGREPRRRIRRDRQAALADAQSQHRLSRGLCRRGRNQLRRRERVAARAACRRSRAGAPEGRVHGNARRLHRQHFAARQVVR